MTRKDIVLEAYKCNHPTEKKLERMQNKLTDDLNTRYIEQWAKVGVSEQMMHTMVHEDRINGIPFQPSETSQFIQWYLDGKLMFIEKRTFEKIIVKTGKNERIIRFTSDIDFVCDRRFG